MISKIIELETDNDQIIDKTAEHLAYYEIEYTKSLTTLETTYNPLILFNGDYRFRSRFNRLSRNPFMYVSGFKLLVSSDDEAVSKITIEVNMFRALCFFLSALSSYTLIVIIPERIVAILVSNLVVLITFVQLFVINPVSIQKEIEHVIKDVEGIE